MSSSCHPSISEFVAKVTCGRFGSRSAQSDQRPESSTSSLSGVPSSATALSHNAPELSIQDFFKAPSSPSAEGSTNTEKWTIPMIGYQPKLDTDPQDTAVSGTYVFTMKPDEEDQSAVPAIEETRANASQSNRREHVSRWAFNRAINGLSSADGARPAVPTEGLDSLIITGVDSPEGPSQPAEGMNAQPLKLTESQGPNAHTTFLRELPSIKRVVSNFDHLRTGSPTTSAKVSFRTPSSQVEAYELTERQSHDGKWAAVVEQLDHGKSSKAPPDSQEGLNSEPTINSCSPSPKFMEVMHGKYLSAQRRRDWPEQDKELSDLHGQSAEPNGRPTVDTYLNNEYQAHRLPQSAADDAASSTATTKHEISSPGLSVVFVAQGPDASSHKVMHYMRPVQAEHTYLVLSRDETLFGDRATHVPDPSQNTGENSPETVITIGDQTISKEMSARIVSDFNADADNQARLHDTAYTAQLTQARDLISRMPPESSELFACWHDGEFTTMISPDQGVTRRRGGVEDEPEILLVRVEDRRVREPPSETM
ncbi:hypothetical protein IAU59_000803 [Kwoniella sp. CBS 9459]